MNNEFNYDDLYWISEESLLGKHLSLYCGGFFRDDLKHLYGGQISTKNFYESFTEIQKIKYKYLRKIVEEMISAFESGELIKCWLAGSNYKFNGDSPAYVLRYARDENLIKMVYDSAKSFIDGF